MGHSDDIYNAWLSSPYGQINQVVAERRAQRLFDTTNTHKAIVHFFVGDIPRRKNGRVHFRKVQEHLVRALWQESVVRPTERSAMLNILSEAIYSTAYDPLMHDEKVIDLPSRVQRQSQLRSCAVCAANTPDGTKPLCGACHEQYRLRFRYDVRVPSETVLARLMQDADRAFTMQLRRSA